ncbi:unnamed protein product [Hapterophycus canaliculatus]
MIFCQHVLYALSRFHPEILRMMWNSPSMSLKLRLLNTVLTRVFAMDDCMTSIKSRASYIRISGCGQKTPAAESKTPVELPRQYSARFRRRASGTMCRVMRGDPDLVRDIEGGSNHPICFA